MSNSVVNDAEATAVNLSLDPYNTYGLATQGYVWNAIASVSGNFNKDCVKSVNSVKPGLSGDVGVSVISSEDYSGDVNSISSDLSVTIGGESGHRLLTDIDDSSIRSEIETLTETVTSGFDSISSLIPEEATAVNKLADKAYVDDKTKYGTPTYRGSWSDWASVPTDTSLYPIDSKGNRIPLKNDFMTVFDSSGRGKSGMWQFIYSSEWSSAGKDGWTPQYEIKGVDFTPEQLQALNSGITKNAVTSVEAASGRWNEASSKIESTSADIYAVFTSVSENSGMWNSAYESITASSGYWNSTFTTVSSLSAKWNESEGSTKAYTDMMATSALTSAKKYADEEIAKSETTLKEYADTAASSALTSAKEYADEKISEESGTLKEYANTVATSALTSANKYTDEEITSSESILKAYSEFTAASALSTATEISKGYTDSEVLKASASLSGYAETLSTSALSESTKYASFIATSALTSANAYTDAENVYTRYKVDSIFGTVSSCSGKWESASDKVAESASEWDSTTTTVRETSSAYTTFSENSGKWEDVYTTTKEHSAIWEEGGKGGGSKAYTDMMATSALTSAEKYTDEAVVTSIEISEGYAEFTAASALSSAKEYTDDTATTIYDAFKAYSEFTAASALSTANEHTDESIETTRSELSGYSEFVATSALTAANAYTDSISAGIYPSIREYAETLATSALTSAEAYTDSVSAQFNKTKTYELEWDSPSGIEDFASTFANPINGDVIILKKQLFEGAEEEYNYSSFTYCSGSWERMNGEYSADSVFFTEDITATYDIGKAKVNPSTGNVVIEAKGKSVDELFTNLFTDEKNPSSTNPYIESHVVTGMGCFEVGTIVSPMITVYPHSGSYEYGPASNSTFDMYHYEWNGNTVDVNRTTNITFISTPATDEMSSYSDYRTVAVTGHFVEDTVVPVTNLGNECPSKKILNGFTNGYRTSECVTSYRKAFFGSLTTNLGIASVTSTLVRALQGSTTSTPTSSTELVAEYPIGAKCVIIAYPEFCGEAKRIIDGSINMDVKDAFSKTTINVQGADNTNIYSIPYYVYLKNASSENDAERRYTLKFKD